VRDDLNGVLRRKEHRLFPPTHCLRLIDAILAKLQRPLGKAAFALIAFLRARKGQWCGRPSSRSGGRRDRLGRSLTDLLASHSHS
jgi:hypothetical protein